MVEADHEQGGRGIVHTPQTHDDAPGTDRKEGLRKTDVPFAALIASQSTLASGQHDQIRVQLPALQDVARRQPAVVSGLPGQHLLQRVGQILVTQARYDSRGFGRVASPCVARCRKR